MKMNQLNLQNPEFLGRINHLEKNEKNIIAAFTVKGKFFISGFRIFSGYDLLSNNQRWFTVCGDEIKTLTTLDEKRYPYLLGG